jgi:transposase
MDSYLDRLLNFSDIKVGTCVHYGQDICLNLGFLREGSHCPECGNFSDELPQNHYSLIRDLPIFGKHTYLRIPQREYYCSICQCHFIEQLTFINWRRRYTQRYEAYIFQNVQHSSIEKVSREEGLTWDQVNGIFDLMGLKQ